LVRGGVRYCPTLQPITACENVLIPHTLVMLVVLYTCVYYIMIRKQNSVKTDTSTQNTDIKRTACIQQLRTEKVALSYPSSASFSVSLKPQQIYLQTHLPAVLVLNFLSLKALQNDINIMV